MRLRAPDRHIHGFYRPNLYYQAAYCRRPQERFARLTQALRQTPSGRGKWVPARFPLHQRYRKTEQKLGPCLGSSDFAQRCVERAAGNPLFLEHLLRDLEERAGEEVPGTIQSLVLARIDRLAPVDKQALQAASVLGKRFSLDGLRHLIVGVFDGPSGNEYG